MRRGFRVKDERDVIRNQSVCAERYKRGETLVSDEAMQNFKSIFTKMRR